MQTALVVFLLVGWGSNNVWAGVPETTAAVDPVVIQEQNLLKSGDRISITVLGFPDLSREQIILADGTIQLPLVGNVSVSGLTIAQVGTQLTESLRPYVRRPQVSVSLLSIRPLRVSVTGAVRRPGPLVVTPPELTGTQLTDVTDGEVYTLSYALVLAGGLMPNADLRNIVIRRKAVTNQAIAAGSDKNEIRINLWQVLQSGTLSSDLRLQDEDEIIVPTAALSSADQQQLLSSSLAPTTISIQVAGEVNRPGQIAIAPNADVNTAVAAAGGITSGGAKSKVQLLRMGSNGQLEQQTFRFGEASLPLQDGDVIVVDKGRTQEILDFVGQVVNPLGLIRLLF